MIGFKANSSDFQKILQSLSPFFSKSTLDNQQIGGIFCNVLDNIVNIKSINNEMAISVNFPCQTLEKGSFITTGNLINNLIKENKGAEMSLQLNAEGKMLLLAVNKLRCKIGVISGHENQYGFYFDDSKAKKFSISANSLKNIIESISCCAADHRKPNLNAILFHSEIKNNINVLNCVATDGMRLGIINENLEISEEISQLLVPSKVCEYLKTLLSNYNDNISINYTENLVQFNFGAISLTAKLIDADFPKYQAVLAIQGNKTLEFKVDEFVKSVNRVTSIAFGSFTKVKLKISQNQIEISCEEDSNFANDSIEAIFSENEIIEISCNAKLLLDIIQNIKSNIVRIILLDEKSPILIKAFDESNARYIFMPMVS